MEATGGDRAWTLQIHTDFDDIRSQVFGGRDGPIEVMLNSDAHAAHIHGKIVFKVKPLFFGGGLDFFQIRPVQVFKHTVIQMKSVETQANRFLKEFKRAHLPGPGQFEVSPGLTDAMKIKTVCV